MEACYLDANVLVYFENKQSSQYQQSLSMMERLVRQEIMLVISPLVVDEFLFSFIKVLRYRHVLETNIVEHARESLRRVLLLPKLSMVDVPSSADACLRVLDFVGHYRLHPRDAYHLLTMQEHGVGTLATFDSDFEKVFEEGAVKQFV